MRLLLVEDDKEFSYSLRDSFLHDGFIADLVQEGQKAIIKLLTGDYDAIILDVHLPDMSGVEVIEVVRKSGNTIPIVVITAYNEIETKLDLFALGIDDYVPKPFAYKELKSRVYAVIRRYNASSPINNILSVEDLEVNLDTRQVTKSSTQIHLRNKEYILLVYLMQNKGKVLSREMILQHVWGDVSARLKNTVNVHMRWLRKKIDDDFDIKLIHTIHGVGYTFGKKVC